MEHDGHDGRPDAADAEARPVEHGSGRSKGRAGGARPKGGGPAIDPEQDYRSAMQALIARRWGDVWRAVPVALAGDDIEGVHDVRVASRRLRAAMDVAVGCFSPSWYRPLHDAAKAITGALGEVRDRDVLLEALAAERAAAAPAEHAGIDRLIARIERERVTARAEMEAFLRRMIDGSVPREASVRFGAAAAPPPTLEGAVMKNGDAAR